MKTYIELKNMRFHAYHGVFPQEKKTGNEFRVNLKLQVDVSKACLSDSLEDTVNYAAVYDIVKHEMAISSALIEHVAYRIVEQIKNHFPEIETVEIWLAKMTPPVNGEMEAAEIRIIA
ncbi:MAG TPA: dihydroneopterin aldolase [Dysgonamonadaceae bacterium]|nr:dihydroneopterin aldolase [Dysgonamonadaceae bacterium]